MTFLECQEKKIIWITLIFMLLCVFALSACDNANNDQQAPGGNGDNNSANDPTVCRHVFGDWNTVKQSTCKEEGKRTRTCNKCSETEEELIQKSETHTVAIDAEVPATCKDTGLTEGSHCSVCNKVLAAQTVVPPNEDHTPVTDAAVSATCKATGLTEGSHCSVCDKVLVAQTVVPPNEDHTPVTDAAVSATCKATGLTEGSHCSVCKKTLVAQTVIAKTDHNFVDNLCKCGTYKDSVGLAFIKSGDAYILSGIGDCQDSRIVVPATYNGYPVIAIAKDAFKSNSSFYEIILPSSITDIGARAFSGCKGLKTIKIPNGVEYLERETFADCTALETVILSNNIIQIMESCFASCTSLKSINLPETLLKIREHAFYNCSQLKEIALPSSLNEIQQFAFRDCSRLTFKYKGMKWQFKQISKGFEWSANTASCLVLCYDGEFDIFYD